jgi:hypothetical protein
LPPWTRPEEAHVAHTGTGDTAGAGASASARIPPRGSPTCVLDWQPRYPRRRPPDPTDGRHRPLRRVTGRTLPVLVEREVLPILRGCPRLRVPTCAAVERVLDDRAVVLHLRWFVAHCASFLRLGASGIPKPVPVARAVPHTGLLATSSKKGGLAEGNNGAPRCSMLHTGDGVVLQIVPNVWL